MFRTVDDGIVRGRVRFNAVDTITRRLHAVCTMKTKWLPAALAIAFLAALGYLCISGLRGSVISDEMIERGRLQQDLDHYYVHCGEYPASLSALRDTHCSSTQTVSRIVDVNLDCYWYVQLVAGYRLWWLGRDCEIAGGDDLQVHDPVQETGEHALDVSAHTRAEQVLLRPPDMLGLCDARDDDLRAEYLNGQLDGQLIDDTRLDEERRWRRSLLPLGADGLFVFDARCSSRLCRISTIGRDDDVRVDVHIGRGLYRARSGEGYHTLGETKDGRPCGLHFVAAPDTELFPATSWSRWRSNQLGDPR